MRALPGTKLRLADVGMGYSMSVIGNLLCLASFGATIYVLSSGHLTDTRTTCQLPHSPPGTTGYPPAAHATLCMEASRAGTCAGGGGVLICLE